MDQKQFKPSLNSRTKINHRRKIMFKEELAVVEHYIESIIEILEKRPDYYSRDDLLARTEFLEKELKLVKLTMEEMNE